jgi:hypothetical protein
MSLEAALKESLRVSRMIYSSHRMVSGRLGQSENQVLVASIGKLSNNPAQ